MKALWTLDVKENQLCHGYHALGVLNHYFPLVSFATRALHFGESGHRDKVQKGHTKGLAHMNH
jgi:hypothetical protein